MALMSNFYNMGSWGYMGVGPTPNRSFNLTVSVENNQYYYRWYSPGQVSKIGILLYKIGDTTKYAVHKTAYLTVTNLYGASYIIVSANSYDQDTAGIPGSQTLDISYNESDWDFFGGFTADDLKGAAMCFFVKDPSGMSGSAPNGTDYASISSELSSYIRFNYTEVQERFATTIDGSNIYANRAECDKDGNPISTTYAKKSELAGKQDTLTAGENITIDSDGVISAAGGGGETYTAGTGIAIDSDGVISATEVDNIFWCIQNVTTFDEAKAAFTAGKRIVCKASDGSIIGLTAHTGTGGSTERFHFCSIPQVWRSGGAIVSRRYICKRDGWVGREDEIQADWNQTNSYYTSYIKNKPNMADYQKKLTAGTNITIDSDGVISAAGGEEYTAGANITIDNNGVISATGLQKELTAGPGINIDSDSVVSMDSDSIPTEPVSFGHIIAGNNITLTDSDGDLVINAADAPTMTDITDIMVVNSLPANPVATVLYLIPEA